MNSTNFEDIFQSDKDKDGVLNKTEFHSMVNKNKMKNPDVQKGDRMFDLLDKNKVTIYINDT